MNQEIKYSSPLNQALLPCLQAVGCSVASGELQSTHVTQSPVGPAWLVARRVASPRLQICRFFLEDSAQ